MRKIRFVGGLVCLRVVIAPSDKGAGDSSLRRQQFFLIESEATKYKKVK